MGKEAQKILSKTFENERFDAGLELHHSGGRDRKNERWKPSWAAQNLSQQTKQRKTKQKHPFNLGL